jgi:hypothetical protein
MSDDEGRVAFGNASSLHHVRQARLRAPPRHGRGPRTASSCSPSRITSRCSTRRQAPSCPRPRDPHDLARRRERARHRRRHRGAGGLRSWPRGRASALGPRPKASRSRSHATARAWPCPPRPRSTSATHAGAPSWRHTPANTFALTTPSRLAIYSPDGSKLAVVRTISGTTTPGNPITVETTLHTATESASFARVSHVFSHERRARGPEPS